MTSVWFDDLNLLLADAEEEAAAIAADGFFFEVAGKDDGTELTNAEAIVSSVTSDLFDGASHEVTGWESASLPLRVQVVSPTPGGLAAGAARLIATCRKPGIRPLSFTLQDTAPTSVFDVLVATWAHEFDDLDSDLRHRRTYMLTLRCKPFARSETPVSLPGLAVGGAYSETVVATGAATTGWSTTSRYVTRRNLMLNPSFENSTSASPWVAGHGSQSLSVVTDAGAPDPTKVLRVSIGAIASGSRAYVNSTTISVTPGQSYPILARIKSGHAAMTEAGVLVHWYDGAGNRIGAEDWTTVAGSTSSYVVVSFSKTAPVGAVLLRTFPFVKVNAAMSAGAVWYLDAAAVIDLDTVATTTYFDGDSAPSGGLSYYWGSSQGTAGVSIETDICAISTDGTYVFPHGSSTTVAPINVPGVGNNLTYTGSIDVTSHRYVRIKAKRIVSLELDGVAATWVASGRIGAYPAYYFAVPPEITTTAFMARITSSLISDWEEVENRVFEIATVSSLTAGSGRAVARAVSLVGSMPAEATIEVTNNGNPLGDDLVVYSGSREGGFTLLRGSRTAGPVQAANTSTISGFSSWLAEDEGGADTFQIPVNALPEATYLFSGQFAAAGLTVGTTYTLHYRASIIEDPTGTAVEYGVVAGSREFKAALVEYARLPLDLGLLNLPATHVTVSGVNSAVAQLKLWVSASDATWVFDDAWLADMDNGQISVVDFVAAGLSGKVTALEIVPATADRPQQQYLAYSGTAPNQTVREIIPTGWASHRFDPAAGDAQVNVINTATTPGLSVAIEFYPRWDVYAAPIITGADPEE